jgi:hypothetical protein
MTMEAPIPLSHLMFEKTVSSLPTNDHPFQSQGRFIFYSLNKIMHLCLSVRLRPRKLRSTVRFAESILALPCIASGRENS